MVAISQQWTKIGEAKNFQQRLRLSGPVPRLSRCDILGCGFEP